MLFVSYWCSVSVIGVLVVSYSRSIWPNSGISDRLVVVKFSLVAYYWPFLEAEMAAGGS